MFERLYFQLIIFELNYTVNVKTENLIQQHIHESASLSLVSIEKLTATRFVDFRAWIARLKD